LDPKARIEFKNLVRLLAKRGKTIFISSHILTELAEMCDTFLFIDQGSIVYHGTSTDLKKRESGETILEIGTADDPAGLKEWLGFRPGWKIKEELRNAMVASFAGADDGILAAELKAMVESGLRVAEFRKQEQKLEDVFVEIVKRRNGGKTDEA
jgi:ABC-2 type transport system ATP-binding protein